VLTDEASSVGLSAQNPTLNGSLSYAPRNLERFSGIDYRKDVVSASLGAALSRLWTGSLSASYGDGLHYSNPVQLGNALTLNASVNYKPWPQLKMSPTYFKSQLSAKNGGAVLSTQDTLRYRVDYQWTMRLSTRVIVDRTRSSDGGVDNGSWTGSALATYIWHPGTAVYAGYDVTEDRVRPAPYRKSHETAFLKFSYLLRL
jgi:hypothetical protein